MNGRKARARTRALRDRNARLLEEIRAGHPELVGTNAEGSMETWQKGPATVVVPALRDEYPPALREAIQTHRVAAFEGGCQCGAGVRISQAGQYAVTHTVRCPGNSGVIERLATEAGIPTQRVDG